MKTYEQLYARAREAITNKNLVATETAVYFDVALHNVAYEDWFITEVMRRIAKQNPDYTHLLSGWNDLK